MIEVGDVIMDSGLGVMGVVTGECMLGNKRNPWPAWCITIMGGREDGRASAMMKDNPRLRRFMTATQYQTHLNHTQ